MIIIRRYFLLMLRFAIVGCTGLLIDFLITYLLRDELQLNGYVANVSGFVIAASSNFLLNRSWTFSSRDKRATPQFLKFLSVSAAGLALNSFCLFLFYGQLYLGFYLSKSLAIGMVFFWNFFANYFFTFETDRQAAST